MGWQDDASLAEPVRGHVGKLHTETGQEEARKIAVEVTGT